MAKTMYESFKEKIDNMTIEAMNAPVSEQSAIIEARDILQQQLENMTIEQCETIVQW